MNVTCVNIPFLFIWFLNTFFLLFPERKLTKKNQKLTRSSRSESENQSQTTTTALILEKKNLHTGETTNLT